MKIKRNILILWLLIFCIMIPSILTYAAQSERIAGADRYKTAVAISQTGWKTSSVNVVLATGENYPDALCAAPLAKNLEAPVLLTGKSSLNSNTEQEIERLNVKNAYIVGGQGVVSDAVVQNLEKKGVKCVRLYGNDRYETSLEVAKFIGNNFKDKMAKEVFVTLGEGFTDALSVSPIAAKKNMPILLTPKNSLPSCMDGIKSFIADYGISKSYVIGGSDVINDMVAAQFPNVERITGNDSYERNINIIKRFEVELNFNTVYMATGDSYPDALAGSVLAPMTSSPIVLVSNTLKDVTKGFLSSKLSSIGVIATLGGEGAVPSSTVDTIVSLGGESTDFDIINIE